MLAGSLAHEHPVLNTVLMAAVVLVIGGLVVFAKPAGRLLDKANLKLLQALGIANREGRRGRENDPGDDSR